MVRDIAGQIAGQRDDTSRLSGSLTDQLKSLHTIVSSRPEGGPVTAEVDLSKVETLLSKIDLEPIQRRLADIETRIDQRLKETLVAVAQRLNALDKSSDLNKVAGDLGHVVGDLGKVAGRLDAIEEALLGGDGEISGDIDGRMKDLAEAVALQHTTLDDTRATLAADVRDVNASLAEHAMRITRTGESLGELVRAVESLRDEERNTVAQVANLLSTYRSEVQGFVGHTNETHEVHNAELKEVHDALVKLNANQHTLAGSIDQWRSDEAGDLAIIASRIESLEQQAGRPMALLETMSVNMENMHRLTVERYHRRNRFWYWLFGTDDWVAASWPSQAERIAADRAVVNTTQH